MGCNHLFSGSRQIYGQTVNRFPQQGASQESPKHRCVLSKKPRQGKVRNKSVTRATGKTARARHKNDQNGAPGHRLHAPAQRPRKTYFYAKACIKIHAPAGAGAASQSGTGTCPDPAHTAGRAGYAKARPRTAAAAQGRQREREGNKGGGHKQGPRTPLRKTGTALIM